MTDTTERFTDTVENYVKYRPSYPSEVIEVMISECSLAQDTTVADIGSGTGILSKLLLDYGSKVYGVEPNVKMRKAAETYLSAFPNFISVNGSAEQTNLSDQSIDIITVGTAFHWFETDKAKQEFKRILKPFGWVLLIWNVRNTKGSALMQSYENLLMKYSKEYQTSRTIKFDKTIIEDFFWPNKMRSKVFTNIQQFNWEGLKGRLLSTSYCPKESNFEYAPMMTELRSIYNHYQQHGIVEFLYETKLYYGQLN